MNTLYWKTRYSLPCLCPSSIAERRPGISWWYCLLCSASQQLVALLQVVEALDPPGYPAAAKHLQKTHLQWEKNTQLSQIHHAEHQISVIAQAMLVNLPLTEALQALAPSSLVLTDPRPPGFHISDLPYRHAFLQSRLRWPYTTGPRPPDRVALTP